MQEWLKWYLICLFFPISYCADIQNSQCPPLTLRKNIDLTCSTGKTLANECDRKQISGTIAKYGCKTSYIAFDENQKREENKLTCDINGKWSGLKRYEEFRCKDDCGRLTTNARPLIIHGIPSNRTQWPWHAAIFRKHGNSWTYLCGGSIIRNSIVLSAAHCFAIDHHRIHNLEEFRIILGSVSSKFVENLNQDGAQIHWIEKIYISESYDPTKGFQGDLAVVHLKENIEFNENVVPICLPNDYTTDVNALKPGSLGQVAGYGVTEEGTLSQTLRSLDLRIQSNTECFSSLQRIIGESQFCGGNKRGKTWETVCNGDSGGGLIVSSTVYKRFYIHGIVSSGDRVKENNVCHNYAVFTRLYSFVFWIRDVIEEVSGEIASDLQQNQPYPYALRGTETQSVVFTGLPREWTNRITSLQLSHVKFSVDTMLNSLENAKTIEKIQLKNVVLESGMYFKRLVLLPVLENFTIDLLPEENFFERLDETRKFPVPVTQSYLESLIFFEKDFDSGGKWRPEFLVNSGTDIEVTVHIFRLMRVRYDSGQLILQQTSLANRILQSASESVDFILQSLAVHRADLDLTQLVLPSITEIILDKVRPIALNLRQDLSASFTNLTELKTLVLNFDLPRKRELTLDLEPLSREMVHLCISNFHVKAGSENISRKFENLQTFCCFICKLETGVSKLFSNVSSIILELQPGESIPSFQSSRLRSIYLKIDETDVKIRGELSKYGVRGKAISRYISLIRERKTWKSRILSLKEWQHLEYSCRLQSHFWTSQEDYRALRRLKTFEKMALNSGKYKFTGSNNPYFLEEFKGIPTSIQRELKSIYLKSLDITPRVLSEAISKCQTLSSITLSRVILDISGHQYPLIRNQSIEYRIEEIDFKKFRFGYILEYVEGELRAVTIPYQVIGRFRVNSSNIISHLFQNLNSIRLTREECVAYWLETNLAEGRAFQAFVLHVTSMLEEGHILKQFIRPLKRMYGTLKEGVLPMANSVEFNGLHVILQPIIDEFLNDIYIKVLGPTGIIDYISTKFSKFVSLERATSLSLSPSKNPLNFPPLLAIAAALNEHKVE